MHTLNSQKLKGLVIEETGAEEDSRSVSDTVKCIENLKSFANFDASLEVPKTEQDFGNQTDANNTQPPPPANHLPPGAGMGLNLGYTINLNLPATTDVAVFNAIFKSLRENLLRSGDE